MSYEKSKLLMEAFEIENPIDRRMKLLQFLEEESDLSPTGYLLKVEFHLTKEDILDHKADNLAHVELTPTRHLVEILQDYLYDSGGMLSGDFQVLSCEEA